MKKIAVIIAAILLLPSYSQLYATEINLTIGSKTAYINNKAEELQCAPKLIKGKTMVPIRLISEQFGNEVLWDKETATADNYFKREYGCEYFEVVVEGEIDDLKWIKLNMNKLLDERGTLFIQI